jgi:hypothetical protein
MLEFLQALKTAESLHYSREAGYLFLPQFAGLQGEDNHRISDSAMHSRAAHIRILCTLPVCW